MKMSNNHRLNEVMHRLIKKKSIKGNTNIQQVDRTFTVRVLQLKFLLRTILVSSTDKGG